MYILKSHIAFLLFIFHTRPNDAKQIVSKSQQYLEMQSVEIFRQYLRIDTSKEENLQSAVDFWSSQFSEIKIPYEVYKPAGKPIIVATVEGSEPRLPSIMLNSHMDVVTANAAEWKYPPFDAYMDDNGDIYARGAQDTKDVGIQYLEAIRKLIKCNATLARTIHITLMPDEETGGYEGIKPFVKTPEFQALNIGFALDEGLTSEDDYFYAMYVDRRAWQMSFTIHGKGGHASIMPDNSTMEKMQRFINTVMDYRESQKQIAEADNTTEYNGYNSLNINVLNGGLSTNVIPSTMQAVVDMRLSPQADVDDLDKLVKSWMDAAGDTEVEYIVKDIESRATAVDDSNPYWVAMRNTMNNLGYKLLPVICPATSDMVVIRNLGIPAIGFSTKIRTIQRIHDIDEYQNAEIFVKGIDIYAEVIKSLANVP